MGAHFIITPRVPGEVGPSRASPRLRLGVMCGLCMTCFSFVRRGPNESVIEQRQAESNQNQRNVETTGLLMSWVADDDGESPPSLR